MGFKIKAGSEVRVKAKVSVGVGAQVCTRTIGKIMENVFSTVDKGKSCSAAQGEIGDEINRKVLD